MGLTQCWSLAFYMYVVNQVSVLQLILLQLFIMRDKKQYEDSNQSKCVLWMIWQAEDFSKTMQTKSLWGLDNKCSNKVGDLTLWICQSEDFMDRFKQEDKMWSIRKTVLKNLNYLLLKTLLIEAVTSYTSWRAYFGGGSTRTIHHLKV